VIALDSTHENLRFASIRKSQEGIRNIQFVLADILSHPLRDDHFDAAIMNGVLEWIGAASSNVDPCNLQRAALKNVLTLLRKGGHFYLAIENRFGYRYFLGRKDEHSDMRFTSLLPRGLANAYSRLVRRVEYRTYTHSLTTYRKLLEQTGFTNIQFFIALPDYRFPRYIIPADDPKVFLYVLEHYLKGHPKVSSLAYYPTVLAARMGWYKYLAPAFIIVSQKGQSDSSDKSVSF
jgi:SAM-dependent methyltransferase